MSLKNRLVYDTLRSRTSASMTGSYLTLGSALSFPCGIVKIVNNSTADITISTDGTNDHDFIPAGGFCLYDNTSNSPNELNACGSIYAEKGRQYYVKGSAGSGAIYLVTQHIAQG